MKNLKFKKGKSLLTLFLFSLILIGFESCTSDANSLIEDEKTINTRDDDQATYQAIADLMTSTLDRYNTTFEETELHLKNTNGVVTIDVEKLEIDLANSISLEQEELIFGINIDLQVLHDLLSSVLEDGLSAKEMEQASWLWLQIIYPDVDFENLENEIVRLPDCPCKNKQNTCKFISYSIYVGAMAGCSAAIACPPCAYGCLIANALVLANNMDSCDNKYDNCLKDNDC